MVSDRTYCEEMLPRVSRTFALCIRLLPPDLEYPVLVAYLLCRIADTIEDSPALPPKTRQRLLHRFAESLDRDSLTDADLAGVFPHPATSEEHLAHCAESVMREFRRLPVKQQAAIRPWVQEMCTGMGEFAVREPEGETLAVLTTVEDLERYCYYVAGTVGQMLTRLYGTGRQPIADARLEALERLATSFGLGLQLTNIVKDVADDRRRGWSFVPESLCRQQGLRPDQLQAPAFRRAARKVVSVLIDKAAHHLCDARDYCTTLPRGLYRVRVFCLTSMFLAVRTLQLARRDSRLLDPDHKVKISRVVVYRTLFATVLVAPSNTLIRWYFDHLARRAVPALGPVRS